MSQNRRGNYRIELLLVLAAVAALRTSSCRLTSRAGTSRTGTTTGDACGQVTRFPDGPTSTLRVAYEVRDGNIVTATKAWNGGPKTVYRFNTQRYLESEERDPTGPAPVLITSNPNVASNESTRVAIRCYDAGGRVR